MGQLSLFSLSSATVKGKLVQWAVWFGPPSCTPTCLPHSLLAWSLWICPFDWSIIAPYQIFYEPYEVLLCYSGLACSSNYENSPQGVTKKRRAPCRLERDKKGHVGNFEDRSSLADKPPLMKMNWCVTGFMHETICAGILLETGIVFWVVCMDTLI